MKWLVNIFGVPLVTHHNINNLASLRKFDCSKVISKIWLPSWRALCKSTFSYIDFSMTLCIHGKKNFFWFVNQTNPNSDNKIMLVWKFSFSTCLKMKNIFKIDPKNEFENWTCLVHVQNRSIRIYYSFRYRVR